MTGMTGVTAVRAATVGAVSGRAATEARGSVADQGPAGVDPAFLRETEVVDFSRPEVRALARRLAEGKRGVEEVARACFEWVRDEIQHCVDYGREELTCAASEVLREGTGFCYAKSHLLVALLRANGIPAGFCYQRLASGKAETGFVLHGLAAVYLPEFGWYRVDPRGNKEGVDAQFTPPVERLAFANEAPGERLFEGVFAEPAGCVVEVLRGRANVSEARANLPDAAEESQLAT